MSATTEKLIEQIEELRAAISVEEIRGNDASTLKENLSILQKRLQTAQHALTESKQILKG